VIVGVLEKEVTNIKVIRKILEWETKTAMNKISKRKRKNENLRGTRVSPYRLRRPIMKNEN